MQLSIFLVFQSSEYYSTLPRGGCSNTKIPKHSYLFLQRFTDNEASSGEHNSLIQGDMCKTMKTKYNWFFNEYYCLGYILRWVHIYRTNTNNQYSLEYGRMVAVNHAGGVKAEPVTLRNSAPNICNNMTSLPAYHQQRPCWASTLASKIAKLPWALSSLNNNIKTTFRTKPGRNTLRQEPSNDRWKQQCETGTTHHKPTPNTGLPPEAHIESRVMGRHFLPAWYERI